MQKLLTGAALTVLAALVVLFAVRLGDRDEGREFRAAASAGELPAAPLFDLPRLDAGGRLTLASLRGKPAVINFWASWCDPCRDEAPTLNAGAARYGREAAFVGVNSDDLSDDARAFARAESVPYALVKDTGGVKRSWGVTGFPETFVLDARGRAVAHFSGPIEEGDLADALRQAERS